MVTMVFPDSVDALGREAVVFIPTVANPAAVKLTELNAAGAIMLTCAIRTFNATMEQSKTKKMRLCETQGFDSLGRTNWTIERLSFIDDPQAPITDAGYPHKALVNGTSGFLLRRRGLNASVNGFEDFAIGDLYDIFPVQFGSTQPVPVAPEEDGQEFEYMQEVAVKGPRVEGAIVA